VDRTGLDELLEELATLEAAETRISAERRRLHHQIDYGFANAATLAREREVSDERRRLHHRIDSLRELLRAEGHLTGGDKEPAAPDSSLSALSNWSGISPELAPIDDAFAEQPEL
jgi:hypothetical protein